MKTLDDYFRDWEAHVFGFGYGTGEEHVITALRGFMDAVPASGAYDYKAVEVALGPQVAWLLINALCHADTIGYGSSPRFGWLDHEYGAALKAYMDGKSVEELTAVLNEDYDAYCYPNHCNCDGAVKCKNPFWKCHC